MGLFKNLFDYIYTMDYETDKGKKGEEYNPDEMTTIRIILKSQETKNLEYVANTIVKNAKEKQFVVRGPKFMVIKIEE